VRVNSWCDIQDCIILNDAMIGRYTRIRRAIIDTGAAVPEGSEIGFNLEEDRAKGYTVTDSGIVVVPSDYSSPSLAPVQ
jgi:glucose-1-phosphate adenylyltransferase